MQVWLPDSGKSNAFCGNLNSLKRSYPGTPERVGHPLRHGGGNRHQLLFQALKPRILFNI
jgi:hypothetical protein